MLSKHQIEEAIEKLKNNQVIILPTDTIYGLSAIYSVENNLKINEIKKSDVNKPLIILVANNQQAIDLSVQPDFLQYLDNERTTHIFPVEKTTIGIRKIFKPDLIQIIEKSGPIISTSVNFHKDNAINEYEKLVNFSSDISVFFDKDFIPYKASKIVDLTKNETIRS